MAISTASLLVPWITPPPELTLLLLLLPFVVLLVACSVPMLLSLLLAAAEMNLSGRPQSLPSQSIITWQQQQQLV
jgi:hypothetical protein